MEFIEFKIEDSVAWIQFNRPDKYNSFVRQMAMEFQACLDDCASNAAVRAVLITGSGKAFCAGQDLQEAVAAKDDGLRNIVSEHYNPIIKKIVELKKPVIAAVNGVAAGAGANIALACDIVLAHEHASFIQAFSKIGLIPDSAGTYTLPRLVGFQRAAALMMTGDKVSAAEACAMGMIYKVFQADQYEEEVKTFALRMAKMPTKALAMTKELLQKSIHNNILEQAALEEEYQFEASLSEDYQEGVQAFLEKRKANFKGA